MRLLHRLLPRRAGEKVPQADEGESLASGTAPHPPEPALSAAEGAPSPRKRGEGYWLAAALLLAVLIGWIFLGPIPDIARSDTPTVVDRNGVVLYEPLSLRGDRSEAIQPNALPA